MRVTSGIRRHIKVRVRGVARARGCRRFGAGKKKCPNQNKKTILERFQSILYFAFLEKIENASVLNKQQWRPPNQAPHGVLHDAPRPQIVGWRPG